MGPDTLNSPGAHAAWMMSVGLLTSYVWMPWLTYDFAKYGYVHVEAEGSELLVGFPPDPSGVTAPPPTPDFDFGDYHALVIGVDHYRSYPRLETAIADARGVKRLLEEGYGYRVQILEDPGRSEVVDALYRYRRELDRSDNLLIYYAGHGVVDETSGEGYWLPADAGASTPTYWISNATISTALRGIRAKHVLIVADSCFSGSLTRDPGPMAPDAGWVKLARTPARLVLTSGGMEPVADGGGGRHSVFAKYFLRALEENEEILDGNSLFARIRQLVMDNANQTPRYGVIRESGHEGGDFLFVPRPSAERREAGLLHARSSSP